MNKCYFCGGHQIEQLTTFVYEDKGQVWIVRNVPTFVCEQCGERLWRWRHHSRIVGHRRAR